MARLPRLPQKLPAWILLAALVSLGTWLLFFDSHSLLRRWTWHREHARLEAENQWLEAQILDLGASLEADLTDDVVERIAREEYGMRRPGETVYRVENE